VHTQQRAVFNVACHCDIQASAMSQKSESLFGPRNILPQEPVQVAREDGAAEDDSCNYETSEAQFGRQHRSLLPTTFHRRSPCLWLGRAAPRSTTPGVLKHHIAEQCLDD